jgi:hypothetical protein
VSNMTRPGSLSRGGAVPQLVLRAEMRLRLDPLPRDSCRTSLQQDSTEGGGSSKGFGTHAQPSLGTWRVACREGEGEAA